MLHSLVALWSDHQTRTRHDHTMDLIIAGGDVVTMNGAREVLVGGSVAVADGLIVAVGSTVEVAAPPIPRRPSSTPPTVSSHPGMINAHQHLTGDPLVRSCIPDLLPPGASIFEWSVPIHAEHTADDDELSATLSARRVRCRTA